MKCSTCGYTLSVYGECACDPRFGPTRNESDFVPAFESIIQSYFPSKDDDDD